MVQVPNTLRTKPFNTVPFKTNPRQLPPQSLTNLGGDKGLFFSKFQQLRKENTKKFDKIMGNHNIIVAQKYDGFSAFHTYEKPSVIYSKNLKPYYYNLGQDCFQELETLSNLLGKQTVLCMELYNTETESYTEVASGVDNGTFKLVILDYANETTPGLKYSERLDILKTIFSNNCFNFLHNLEFLLIKNNDSMLNQTIKYLNEDWEGVVITFDTTYANRDGCKIKNISTCHVPIIGFTYSIEFDGKQSKSIKANFLIKNENLVIRNLITPIGNITVFGSKSKTIGTNLNMLYSLIENEFTINKSFFKNIPEEMLSSILEFSPCIIPGKITCEVSMVIKDNTISHLRISETMFDNQEDSLEYLQSWEKNYETLVGTPPTIKHTTNDIINFNDPNHLSQLQAFLVKNLDKEINPMGSGFTFKTRQFFNSLLINPIVNLKEQSYSLSDIPNEQFRIQSSLEIAQTLQNIISNSEILRQHIGFYIPHISSGMKPHKTKPDNQNKRFLVLKPHFFYKINYYSPGQKGTFLKDAPHSKTLPYQEENELYIKSLAKAIEIFKTNISQTIFQIQQQDNNQNIGTITLEVLDNNDTSVGPKSTTEFPQNIKTISPEFIQVDNTQMPNTWEIIFGRFHIHKFTRLLFPDSTGGLKEIPDSFLQTIEYNSSPESQPKTKTIKTKTKTIPVEIKTKTQEIISKMTIAQLKDYLRSKKLPLKGNKKELIQRVLEN